MRILLVDDNAINQKVAVRILQQFGYQPEVAGNGREALDKLDHQPFDFIFMDVMMPEMDGLEATRHDPQAPDDRRTQQLSVAHHHRGDDRACDAGRPRKMHRLRHG